jgi:hypothetical protein
MLRRRHHAQTQTPRQQKKSRHGCGVRRVDVPQEAFIAALRVDQKAGEKK